MINGSPSKSFNKIHFSKYNSGCQIRHAFRMSIFVLLMIYIPFVICLSQYKENEFTFTDIVSKVEASNAYREFPLSRGGIPSLLCGVECSTTDTCIGMEICGGILCRLWKGSFFSNVSGDSSSDTCRRYSKVGSSDLNTLQETSCACSASIYVILVLIQCIVPKWF